MTQMAQRAQSGASLLRPIWRAAFWALTEFPALLEEALPAAPVLPSPPATSLLTQPSTHVEMPSQPPSAAGQRNITGNATTSPAALGVGAHRIAARIQARAASGAAVYRSVEL